MRTSKKIIFSIFCLLILSTLSVNAQSGDTKIGEIFSKTAADQQFGSVLESISISTNILKDLIAKSEKTLMFKIIDKEIYVLNNNRDVIYPSGKSVGADVKFVVYSISVLNDLISNGGQSTTQVEVRSEVISLTNGIYTLEMATWCPPFCQ